MRHPRRQRRKQMYSAVAHLQRVLSRKEANAARRVALAARGR